MQEARKSLIAAGAVIAVIGATVAGGLLRNRMEVGPRLAVGGPITMESLVSSMDGVPDTSDAAKSPIGVSTFFYQLSLLLEKEYVDEIKDEQELAIGAIRNMVNSLADSDSVFMKPDQMAAFQDRQRGLFEGIGVELKLVYDEYQLRKLQNESIGATGPDSDANYDPVLLIPTVVVTATVQGGPADKAGIKVGDRIMRVNGKWALSSEEVDEIRQIRARFDAGEMEAPEFQRTVNEFRERYEAAITPGRVTDQLLLGKSGKVEVAWRSSDGKEYSSTIEKSATRMPAVEIRDDTLYLHFFKGAPAELKQLELPQQLTIDLRQSTIGDFGVMRECLEILAPNGEYGAITRTQAGATRKLSVSGSTAPVRSYKLVVDSSTWGAAAVFAMALSSRDWAVIAEGELTRSLPWIEVVELPDGSGYSLRTGTFEAMEVQR